MSSLGPNPNIPQIPTPVGNLASLTLVVLALKQAVDSLAGFRGAPTDRAVTFNDLSALQVYNPKSLTGFATTADVAAEAAARTAGDTAVSAQLAALGLDVVVVTMTGTLPAAFTGTVFVDNLTGGVIQITLPASPTFGQSIDLIDAAGNASSYNILIVGPINGQPFAVFNEDYQSARFKWNGSRWSLA